MTSDSLAVYGLTTKNWRSPFGNILNEVSFELPRGKIAALFGPNGAGKSTLLKILSGIIPLDSSGSAGQIWYRGQEVLNSKFFNRAQAFTYVGSDFRPEFPLTVEETVSLGRVLRNQGMLFRLSKKDRSKIESAMKKCLCWHLRKRNLETLSGGERQLVFIASALAQDPKILLLDESFSKMDLNHQTEMGKLLQNLAKNEGLSVILVSHDMNFALEWADRAMILNKGTLVATGEIAEVVTRERLELLYPGCHWEVGQNPFTQRAKVFYAGG